MSDEIAVVGSQTFTTGFRLAGVRRFAELDPDASTEQYDAAVEEVLATDAVGIVIMHDADLERLSRAVRERVETSVEPTVVTIGGGGGASGLRQNIKRAIGIDLMEEDS
ncbi:MAG: V-type ATP synthase subunit F [Haloferacaceae archaeon]|jgi:V/A-type H+-transporting ATPase subunit F|nr:V-type ATP synthase subunit F [Haloferacaceae archaeon]